MKTATQVLLFNQDKWILQNIENSGKFVDKIYISWSPIPWNYNQNARKLFKNNSNLAILEKSKYRHKIEIIKGNWDLEEHQRNACLEQAKKDKIDFLITHDADEFYTFEAFDNIINGIKKNPDYDYYTTPWITFWKNFNNVIINKDNSIICGYPEIAINVNSDNKFIRCRRISGDKILKLDSICHHASYVLTDKECWEKINTWGHSHQFNLKKWYDEKWINWNNLTENLHPISPEAWKKTTQFSDTLPEVLLSI
jgi:hypothetical protein